MRSLTHILLFVALAAGSAAGQFARTDSRRERELAALQYYTEPLYRKPTNAELKLLEPPAAVAAKYASWRKGDDRGLTKLVPDRGCAENVQVVNASDKCLGYTMPGAGASFSFRVRNYRIQRLADLTLTDNSFQSLGFAQAGIMVNLGDIAPESVTLATRGMKFLADYEPPTSREKLGAFENEFGKGVQRDGFIYRRGFFVRDDATFALRSVALGGRLERTANGVRYNEFDFDKRRDVIVVFRVVAREPDGSVTIVWRILSEQRSPDLEKEKREDVK